MTEMEIRWGGKPRDRKQQESKTPQGWGLEIVFALGSPVIPNAKRWVSMGLKVAGDGR